jgi:hypothetical protein
VYVAQGIRHIGPQKATRTIIQLFLDKIVGARIPYVQYNAGLNGRNVYPGSRIKGHIAILRFEPML